jgi:hypothetical protein
LGAVSYPYMMTVEDTAVMKGTETTGMNAGTGTTDMIIDGKEAEGFFSSRIADHSFRKRG